MILKIYMCCVFSGLCVKRGHDPSAAFFVLVMIEGRNRAFAVYIPKEIKKRPLTLKPNTQYCHCHDYRHGCNFD
jgi:hypothetical protein